MSEIRDILKNFRVNNLYLNENFNYFKSKIAPWIEKQNPQDSWIEKLNPILREKGFRLLGKGSYRVAYLIPGRDDIVLKLATKGTEPRYQNKLEVAAGTKSGYASNLFAKTYEHGPDFNWIVQERLDPVNTDSRYFKEVIPELASVLIANNLDPYYYKAAQIWASEVFKHGGSLKNITKGWEGVKKIPFYQYPFNATNRGSLIRIRQTTAPLESDYYRHNYMDPSKNIDENWIEFVDELFKEGTNEFLLSLYKAALEHDVEIWDVRKGNVGISLVTGKPKLLDSSIAVSGRKGDTSEPSVKAVSGIALPDDVSDFRTHKP